MTPLRPNSLRPASVLPSSPSARRERYLTAILQAQLKLLHHTAGRQVFPEVLRIVGEAAGACRAYFFENTLGADEQLYMTQRAEWCAPGVRATLNTGAFSNLAYDDFLPVWREVLRPDHPFAGSIDVFPEAARELLATFDVKALLVFPLFANNLFSGFIGFVSTQDKEPWTETESDLLKGAATAMQFSLERQEAEKKLAHERDVLVTVLRTISDPVMVVNADESVAMANHAALQMLGVPPAQVLGCKLSDLFTVSDFKEGEPVGVRECIAHVAMRDHVRVDRVEPGLLRTRRKHKRMVVESATPLAGVDPLGEGALIVLRDVTDQLRAWREVDNARRLESVGILAGGIAHNFNNLLMAVLGHINLAKMAAGTDTKEAVRWLEKAESSVMRGRDLTERMLTFAGGGAPSFESLDLSRLVQNSVKLASAGQPSRVVFETQGTLRAMVDHKMIQQALQHVINNALIASAETEAPVVVRIACIEEPEMEPEALIEVVDDGIGIAPELRGRVFDPFFSTDAARTGLGLATAHSIVSRHRGRIELESEPGQGTRVRIWLPLSQTLPDQDAKTQNPEQEQRRVRRIAILEDDETLRVLFESMLDRMGFEVGSSTTGEGFLQLFREASEAGRPFDLSILDLTIHDGMGGRQTFEHLRAIDPDARCIVTSGYSNDPAMVEPVRHGFVAALRKPFHVDGLRAALRAAGIALNH